MKKVEVFFEVELPYWIRMKDGRYDIIIDGKNWPIYLFNEKWKVTMGNEFDGSGEVIALPNNKEETKNIPNIFKNKPYYHYEKLKTVLKTGFGWNIPDNSTNEDAKEKVKKEFIWCTTTVLKQTNRFIEIYRNSIEDKSPHTLGFFELSKNFWYSILLNGNWIEGKKIYSAADKLEKLLDDKTQNAIVEKLKTNYYPPLWSMLLENSASLYNLGRYRTAYIESVSAFEVFLTTIIREQLEKKYEKNLIDYLMKKSDFEFLLKNGLEIAIGKSFEKINKKLWEKWIGKGNVLNLRNKIIHDGYEVSMNETETAIMVISGMISEIRKTSNDQT